MTAPYLPEPADPGSRGVVSSERSIGELIGEATRDLSTLMRQELELAKAELRESAASAGKGSGLLAGAGVAAHFGLLFWSIGLWWGLGMLLGLAWSGVVVGLIWVVTALVLALLGKAELQRIRGLPDTADTISKIPNALKGNEEENR